MVIFGWKCVGIGIFFLVCLMNGGGGGVFWLKLIGVCFFFWLF